MLVRGKMAFLGNKNFPINTIMVTLKFIFIFFLIFVIAILLRNRSNFISTTPKLKTIAKLESQVTISNDDKNTRIKKMSNYYLTPKEVELITAWRSKTQPEQLRSSFNIELFLKIKRLKHESKNETNRNSSESN